MQNQVALGKITMYKTSGGGRPSIELFQILKDDAVNMLYSLCQQIWKNQQWPQDWKRSVFIQISKKGNAKEGSNCHIIALISQGTKEMLQILQARLQQYMNCELTDVQAGFRRGRKTRDQIANICWIIKKAREFNKNIFFCFIDYAKAFNCVDHSKLWKLLQEMGNQTTWPASWETCMQVKKQQLELGMEKQTGSKSGKEYIKAVYCHRAYLTYAEYVMWNAGLDETQTGIKIA